MAARLKEAQTLMANQLKVSVQMLSHTRKNDTTQPLPPHRWSPMNGHKQATNHHHHHYHHHQENEEMLEARLKTIEGKLTGKKSK